MAFWVIDNNGDAVNLDAYHTVQQETGEGNLYEKSSYKLVAYGNGIVHDLYFSYNEADIVRAKERLYAALMTNANGIRFDS